LVEKATFRGFQPIFTDLIHESQAVREVPDFTIRAKRMATRSDPPTSRAQDPIPGAPSRARIRFEPLRTPHLAAKQTTNLLLSELFDGLHELQLAAAELILRFTEALRRGNS
jgi:hypothetical protein